MTVYAKPLFYSTNAIHIRKGHLDQYLINLLPCQRRYMLDHVSNGTDAKEVFSV